VRDVIVGAVAEAEPDVVADVDLALAGDAVEDQPYGPDMACPLPDYRGDKPSRRAGTHPEELRGATMSAGLLEIPDIPGGVTPAEKARVEAALQAEG
jgi:hypothetical protein